MTWVNTWTNGRVFHEQEGPYERSTLVARYTIPRFPSLLIPLLIPFHPSSRSYQFNSILISYHAPPAETIRQYATGATHTRPGTTCPPTLLLCGSLLYAGAEAPHPCQGRGEGYAHNPRTRRKKPTLVRGGRGICRFPASCPGTLPVWDASGKYSAAAPPPAIIHKPGALCYTISVFMPNST
jgi:hypothetical protein